MKPNHISQRNQLAKKTLLNHDKTHFKPSWQGSALRYPPFQFLIIPEGILGIYFVEFTTENIYIHYTAKS